MTVLLQDYQPELLFGYGERDEAGRRFNHLVCSGQVKAPLVMEETISIVAVLPVLIERLKE